MSNVRNGLFSGKDRIPVFHRKTYTELNFFSSFNNVHASSPIGPSLDMKHVSTRYNKFV